MKHFLLSLVFCAVMSLPAQPALYLPEPVREPVQIDGLADDPLWAEAGIAGGFISSRGTWPREWTTVRAAYDAEALYLLAQGAILPGSTVTSNCRQNDDMGVFSDESLEIFLAPEQLLEDGRPQTGSNPVYFHLCFNLNGFFYSARKRDLSWQPEGILQKSSLRNRHWLMELRIPFAALQTSCPAPATRWQVNFARNRRGGEADVSSWSGSSDFHAINTFGRLHFGVTPAWQPAVITLLNISASQVRCTLQLPVNPPADLQAQILLDQAVVLSSKGINLLTPGFITFDETIRNTFLPLKGNSRLAFKVFSESTKQVFLDQQAGLVWNFQNALELDKYYYTPADSKLQFSLNPGAAAGNGKIEKLEISLLQDCAVGGKSLQAMTWQELSGSLPLDRLPFGTLYLKASWQQDGNPYQTLRAFQLNPQPLQPPPLPQKAILSIRNTRLLLNDTPVFLVSASPTQKHFLQNQACFNLSYGQYGLQENAVRLEAVQGASLLRKDGWTGYTFPPWESLQEIFRKQFSGHPAGQNRFCRIAYEAQMGAACKNPDGILTDLDPPAWYRQIYRELKQLSPETVFSIHIDKFSAAGEFAPACDLLEAASWSSSYGFDMLTHLQRDMTEIRAACPDKPVLFWLGGTIPNNHCRTAEELRAAAFLAVANDLAGIIIHMGHGYLPAERSRVWSMLSNLNAEIQPVFQFFQQAGQPGSYPFGNTRGFHLAVRQKAGVLTVIAVNQSGSLNTLALPEAANILLPFENNRTLKRPEDSFSPYEAKVYQMRFNP